MLAYRSKTVTISENGGGEFEHTASLMDLKNEVGSGPWSMSSVLLATCGIWI